MPEEIGIPIVEWLRTKIKEQARRPMQEVGVYDPMEQAGHRDMVSVKYVLGLLDDVVCIPKKQLRDDNDRTEEAIKRLKNSWEERLQKRFYDGIIFRNKEILGDE